MEIFSPAFKNGGAIPIKYTCDGDNISPPLEIRDIPKDTKSIVLIVEDPDVPPSIKPDGIYHHWLVWDIPAGTGSIIEGKEPGGVTGQNSSGTIGYIGPCPPYGKHRYYFDVYALDIGHIGLNTETATADEIREEMERHILDSAQLMGTYEREE